MVCTNKVSTSFGPGHLGSGSSHVAEAGGQVGIGAAAPVRTAAALRDATAARRGESWTPTAAAQPPPASARQRHARSEKRGQYEASTRTRRSHKYAPRNAVAQSTTKKSTFS